MGSQIKRIGKVFAIIFITAFFLASSANFIIYFLKIKVKAKSGELNQTKDDFEKESKYKIFPLNLTFTDENNVTFNLQSITKKQECFFYYISDGACPPCVEKDIQILEEFSLRILPIKTIVITNFDNIRKFILFKNQIGSNLTFFNSVKSLDIENDPYVGLSFFILDKDSYVKMIQISDPTLQINDDYFCRVEEYFSE